MTPPSAINLASAAAGSAGTILLFRGSFGFESGGFYGSLEMYKAMFRRNEFRQLFQRIGLLLLLLGFVLQGVAAVAEPSPG